MESGYITPTKNAPVVDPAAFAMTPKRRRDSSAAFARQGDQPGKKRKSPDFEFVQGSSSGNAMCAPTYIESDEVLARRLAAEWGEIEVDIEDYGMTPSQRTRFDSDEELARRLAAEELSNADAAPQDNDATMDVLIETSSLPPRGVAEWRFL